MKSRYLAIALIGFALMGASCDKGKITPAESELLGCDAFASALTSLAPLRANGKLNPDVVNVVNQTKAGVDPICTGAAPAVDSKVKDVIVDGGTKALLAIFAAYK